MNDQLTEQIVQKLNELSIKKKKAILELINEDATISKTNKTPGSNWRYELLTTSVWSESEIDEIYKAREYLIPTL
jgi:hypothetical protein